MASKNHTAPAKDGIRLSGVNIVCMGQGGLAGITGSKHFFQASRDARDFVLRLSLFNPSINLMMMAWNGLRVLQRLFGSEPGISRITRSCRLLGVSRMDVVVMIDTLSPSVV